MNKTASIILTLGLVLTIIVIFMGRSGVDSAQNVEIKNGVQYITINAKGGYTPRVSLAKAGIPTILLFNTQGTFDCSSSVRIPSMNISKNLLPSGLTDIDLGSPSVATLQGLCGMGMYTFEIEFLL